MLALSIAASAACKDKSPTNTGIGLVEVGATSHAGPANGVVSGTITVAVLDAGKPVAGQIVSFSVLNGGGFLIGKTTDTTDANGEATAPTWQLGKGAGPQTLRAASGALKPLDISATVQTNFNIVIRFFKAQSMTAAQEALFTSAAQRISGVVTADVADVQLSNESIAGCDSSLTTPLTEIVDDLVIYATISDIDGPSKILASSGPCIIRTGSTNHFIPVVGVMKFDSADLETLTGSGSLEEVITHEMLHALGVGSLWSSMFFGFVSGSGTADPEYNAPAAKAACQAVGGTLTCANGVPLENTGGAGTKESHWRETSFDNELLTGFIDTSPNPFSAITVGSLTDLGYTVNTNDADSYSLMAIMANMLRSPGGNPAKPLPPNWEKLDGIPVYGIDEHGNVRLLRKAQ